MQQQQHARNHERHGSNEVSYGLGGAIHELTPVRVKGVRRPLPGALPSIVRTKQQTPQQQRDKRPTMMRKLIKGMHPR